MCCRAGIGGKIGLQYHPKMHLIRSISVLAAFVAFAAASTVCAQTVVDSEYTTTEILSEAPGFIPGETLRFAVRQQIEPGWHVFWVNPGDAGLALELQWRLPEGFEAGAPYHPVPEYIPVGPLASFAHEGEPVFLVDVADAGRRPRRRCHLYQHRRGLAGLRRDLRPRARPVFVFLAGARKS